MKRAGLDGHAAGGPHAGFTLVELLISTVVVGIVLAGVYGVLMEQARSYTWQQSTAETRLHLRSAAAILSWDLRHASASGGDIYAMDSVSLTVRTVVAGGTVCQEHPTLPRYGLANTSGDWTFVAGDSLLVFGSGAAVPGDDSWKVMAVSSVGTGTTMSVDPCGWSAAVPAPLGVEVTPILPTDTAGVNLGAPVRLFRAFEYAGFTEGGQYWLGRRTPGAVAFDKLAGPLSADGIRFEYVDSLGAATTTPGDVRAVNLKLHSDGLGGGDGSMRDSVLTRLTLRN